VFRREEDGKAEARARDIQAGLREIWRDRLSADALRHPVIAELVARCERCGDSQVVEIGGHPGRWWIRNSRIARDETAVWRHTGCGGRLRFYGWLPEPEPERFASDGERLLGAPLRKGSGPGAG
jgi:hypothetical protein